MQVKSILQYFWPSLKLPSVVKIFVLSVFDYRFTQVLLYVLIITITIQCQLRKKLLFSYGNETAISNLCSVSNQKHTIPHPESASFEVFKKMNKKIKLLVSWIFDSNYLSVMIFIINVNITYITFPIIIIII